MAIKLSEIKTLDHLKAITEGKGSWSEDPVTHKDVLTLTDGKEFHVTWRGHRYGSDYIHPRAAIRAWLVEQGLAEKTPAKPKKAPKKSGSDDRPSVTDKRFWRQYSEDEIATVIQILPEVMEAAKKRFAKRREAEEAKEAKRLEAARNKEAKKQAKGLVKQLKGLGLTVPEDLAKLAE